MRKILDEYTDREDLSADQKCRLRNPERSSQSRLNSVRKWRMNALDKDPCYFDASNKRQRQKKTLKRIGDNHQQIRLRLSLNNNASIGKRKEIIRLHNKGKTISDICIWTSTPVSIVSSVIQQWKDSQK